MTRLRAFLMGMREFRRDLTTHYDEPLIQTYDWGREWAHRLTMRRWDDNYHDWCSDCERETRWDGEVCRRCGYVWGVGR